MTRLPGQRSASSGATPGAPPGALLLQLRIALARLGWFKAGSAMLLAVALLAWLWLLPYGHEQLAARQAAIDATRQRLAAPSAASNADHGAAADATSASARNLARFRATLADTRTVETHLKQLYAIARTAGLVVEQAEYRFSAESHGQFQACQVHLPLRGSYASVRRFAEQALREMPFVALDEIALRRDDARDALPQARLGFTLYLAATPTTLPTPPTEVRR